MWILLGLLILQFLLSFWPGNLAWDGVYYYAYARSIAFDGDLHLENDFQLAYSVTPAHDFAATGLDTIRTPTGRVNSPFAIGTGLLWLPWLALIHGLVRVAAELGIGSAPLTGFERPFIWGIATVTAIYGWGSVVIGYRLIRTRIQKRSALFAAAVLMFVTPVWYYSLREPFYAHAASAMTVALYVTTWWRTTQDHDLSDSTALKLGAVGGLAALVRWQNLAYLALPLLTALWAGRQTLRTSVRYLLITMVAALVTFSPQMAVWTLFYGRPWAIPQGVNFFSPRALWLPQVLLSPFHGLLPWMPVVIPALIGLILLSRSRPRLGWPLVIAFLLQILINSCVRDWFGGGGYGARRFSNTLVILLIGYAALLDRRRPRWIRVGAIALGGVLILHQWLIIRYGFAEQLGGRVIEMAPSYTWSADSLTTFIRRLVGYLPRLAQQPIESMILPASPLTAGPLTAVYQLLLLAASLGTLTTVWWIRRCLRRFVAFRYVVIGTAILIVAFDAWLLTRA